MKWLFSLLSILLVLPPWSSLAIPAEKVTEEYVVKSLNGENKAVVSVKPPGFAFTVVFPPSKGAIPNAKEGGVDRGTEKQEELYRRLVPIGRALESEVLQGYRFLITVTADSLAPTAQTVSGSLKVAEEIKRVLTTDFAIAGERLSVVGTDPPAPGTFPRPASEGPQRWRVEVARLR